MAGATVHCRCADGEYCFEVTARQKAAADAWSAGCIEQAEQLAAHAALLAEVHSQEQQLRDRP